MGKRSKKNKEILARRKKQGNPKKKNKERKDNGMIDQFLRKLFLCLSLGTSACLLSMFFDIVWSFRTHICFEHSGFLEGRECGGLVLGFTIANEGVSRQRLS